MQETSLLEYLKGEWYNGCC